MTRVYVSTVVNARNDRVWARVRDFNGMPNWHPAIAESRIEGGEPADKIGCVRDFRLRNGDRIREKLLGLSDYDMFCTYSILESPMGVENYVATLRLTPVTDGGPEFPEAYVNLSAEVTGLVPAGVVTVTSTAPWAPAGAVTVIDVAVNAVTLPALAPKLTVGVPGVKLVPEMVTTVPPVVGPPAGLIPVTAGGGCT